jgi:3-oxoacyl-[acyl-carrier protein] reductase
MPDPDPTPRRRTALVTGGSGVIGRAIARRFCEAGMQVALLASRPEALAAVVDALVHDGWPASGWPCDLRDTGALAGVTEGIASHHGGIDVVVNCAGILDMGPIDRTTEAEWDSVMDVNLKAAFFVVQHCLPHLRRATHPRVVNIASNAGRMGGYANGMAYTAAKGGLIALTYGLARHLAPDGITVNCVAPGTIESEMAQRRDEGTRRRLLERFPLGRFGTPDEVAAAACYFASADAAFTTGAVLDVNGGLFMG